MDKKQINPKEDTGDKSFESNKSFIVRHSIIVRVTLFTLVSLILIGSGIYWWHLSKVANDQVQSTINDYNNSDYNYNNDASIWQTYQNREYGYEIRYPAGWFVDKYSSSSVQIQSADPKDNAHGIGLPSVGNMWVDVVSIPCENSVLTDLIPESKPDIEQASVCTNNNKIILGLWQADTKKDEHLKTLKDILSSFKILDQVFCGGIAGLPCPTTGWTCKSQGNYPDAGTMCIRNKD